jgi:hypothetical protein
MRNGFKQRLSIRYSGQNRVLNLERWETSASGPERDARKSGIDLAVSPQVDLPGDCRTCVKGSSLFKPIDYWLGRQGLRAIDAAEQKNYRRNGRISIADCEPWGLMARPDGEYRNAPDGRDAFELCAKSSSQALARLRNRYFECCG